MNLKKINITDKGDWNDKINSKDLEYGKKGLLDELMGLLPYKEKTNLIIDKNTLSLLSAFTGDIQETNEKLYAYACFLPQGSFNSCILYNVDENQEDKKMYYFMLHARKRDHPIDIKFKKVKKFKV